MKASRYKGGWLLMVIIAFLPATANGEGLPTREDEGLRGPVKTLHEEHIALSHKLRNWFSGPETQVAMKPENAGLNNAVEKQALPGTRYKIRKQSFTRQGLLQKETIIRGHETLEQQTCYYVNGSIGSVSAVIQKANPQFNKTRCFEHNQEEQLVKRIEKNAAGGIERIMDYEYKNNRLVKKIERHADGSPRRYWKLQYTPEGQLKSNAQYNAQDEFQAARHWVYNASGHVTAKQIHNDKNSITGEFRYEPNEHGKPLSEVFFTSAGGVENRWEYQYDSRGSLISLQAWNRKGRGERTEWKEYDHVYDEQGNWVKKIAYNVRLSEWGRKIRTPIEAIRREIVYYRDQLE